MKVLAPLAWLTGVAMSRPVSGKWLAHYFWGSGIDRPLPVRLEQQVKALVIQCVKDGNVQPASWFCVDVPQQYDLYTCIGRFSARCYPSGAIEYYDPYDWHKGKHWGFQTRIAGLPFSVNVTGNDETMALVGNPFVTCGVIPPHVKPEPISFKDDPVQNLGIIRTQIALWWEFRAKDELRYWYHRIRGKSHIQASWL